MLVSLRDQVLRAAREPRALSAETCIPPSMSETFDAMATTFFEHARPVLREDILPAVQKDVALQRTIGAAMGESIAEALTPWVALSAVAITVYVGWQIVRSA